MLPIRQVVLYKHGVGYFEREGEVSGESFIDLEFRAAEMNDVLKSLTILDLDGGHISSISYESEQPVEKQLEDLAIRIPDQNALTGLLSQVKGARVAVLVGSDRVEGTITGIETISRQTSDGKVDSKYLGVLVDGGGLQIFDLLEVKSLVFLEEGLRKDVQRLLDALISGKKKDRKKLTVFTAGKGKRRILVSYVIETPVWKTSYRALLFQDEARLQGWAIVDNTQDEDWEGVRLTLVAGLPISFRHDLYSPRYKRRPVVGADVDEAYAPPVAGVEVFAASPLHAGLVGDLALEAGEAAGEDAPVPDVAAFRARARAASMRVEARFAELGDLFQYAIQNPVTVRRQESALVPILHTEFDGERVAVYDRDVREQNPMSAIRFRNTTGLTLEGGPVTVLEQEQYVGEAMLETLQPDEERIVPYSVELGCTVTIDHRSERRDVHRVHLAKGVMHLHRYRVQETIYEIRNKTDRKLDLYLDHRLQRGWDLVETPEPVERRERHYRFRVAVPPHETTPFVVQERGDEEEAFAVSGVSQEQIAAWQKSRLIDKATHKRLADIADLNGASAERSRRIREVEEEIDGIFANQKRLRENLESLKEGRDEQSLRQRYVAEMNVEEDRLGDLREEARRLKDERERIDTDIVGRIRLLGYEASLDG